MKSLKLSAIIITFNEEKNIDDCLKTLSFCDEIILVDAGSRDHTVCLARQHEAKIFTRVFDNFSAQKNFALSQASGDWVLSVDADERVSSSLCEEILQKISSAESRQAYRIHRQTYFLKKKLNHSGTQQDRPIRLFKKGSGFFKQPIHEYFETTEPVGELRHTLTHYTTPTIRKEIDKTEFYTDLEVEWLMAQGKKGGALRGVIRGAANFLNHYILKRGFLDGKLGAIFAFFAGRYTWMKYCKLSKEIKKAHQEKLNAQIKAQFNERAKTFPSTIDKSDLRLRALLEACGSVQGKRVLEVGCGKGRFVKVFIENGALVTGLEPAEVLLEEARRYSKGTFLQGFASSLPFADNTFDLVYAVEVIEHLPDLEISLKEMTRVLKEGGSLVLIDRNIFSINHKKFLAPNLLIKSWHEWRNEWMYPKGFPFKERWFIAAQTAKRIGCHCRTVDYRYVLSDGEDRCGWSFLFRWMPFFRIFVLWRGIK